MVLRFQLFITFTERKKKVPFSMATGNWNSCKSVFPNIRAWEQQRMK